MVSYHHNQGIFNLNAEIAARAAITDRFPHVWVFNKDLGVTLCSSCGAWLSGSLGGCQVAAHRAGAYTRKGGTQ